ncbi:MAG: hypothetical protein DDT23_00932 [candidate division WS2 bacterium]|nr:hypothetical protein [Candidatus Lithacetigena glycinireducens]
MAEEQKEKVYLPIIYDASTGKPALPEEIRLAILFADEIGVKPERGHVCLYFGKPWITIEGWYFLLRKYWPKACLKTRPLDINERGRANIPEGVDAWVAEVYTEEGGKLLSMGYGYARQEEPLAPKSTVETRWPWRLAEKRAEEDAIRKAVGL